MYYNVQEINSKEKYKIKLEEKGVKYLFKKKFNKSATILLKLPQTLKLGRQSMGGTI